MDNIHLGGSLEGFLVGKKNVHVSHLEFADDILIFCKDDDVMLNNRIKVIKAYAWLSGFTVNWEKSAVRGINIQPKKVQQVASFMNCQIASFTFLYLGLPFGGNPRSTVFWSPIVEKSRKCWIVGSGFNYPEGVV